MVQTTNVLKTRGLRYVNSSIEKDQVSAVIQDSDDEEQKNNGTRTSASIAHKRAASVASYLQSQINSTLPLTSEEDWSESSSSVYKNHIAIMDSNMESLMSTDSMTAVVAANEEVKQAVASDLSSNVSLPCKWFICDDDHGATRFFVIQVIKETFFAVYIPDSKIFPLGLVSYRPWLKLHAVYPLSCVMLLDAVPELNLC